MSEKEYRRELWIYAVLVIIACVASGVTGMAWGVKINNVLRVIISLAGLCLFLFATVKFALALQLKPHQWLAAILLIALFYVGSVIYMTTRRPPRVPGS